MDLILKLIAFIKKLLGMDTPSLSAGDKAKIKSQAVSGLEDVQGAENIKVHGTGDDAKVIKSEDGADLIEDDGEQLWVNRVDHDIPREQWQDEWGPISGLSGHPQLVEFLAHEQVFNMAHSGDALEAEKKIQGFGYQDVGHFYKVRATIMKYHASPSGPQLGECVFGSQEYINAMMEAGARQQTLEREANMAANPELLAPIEGITIEQYAGIAARLATLSEPDANALLAENGLDRPAFDRVQAGWLDRMQKDETHMLTQVYGAAFTNQGQGQFGAQMADAGGAMMAGGAVSTEAPIPMELNAEIAGALSAWSKTGQDVNALLMSKYNMTAMDQSAANMWWTNKLMQDFAKFESYNKLVEEYEAKIMGEAGKPADDDIDF